MAYGYASSSIAMASSSALGPASQAPITRSRTGLFLSYRDTVIRSTNVNSHYGRYSDKGKGKGRAYDYPGDEAEEHEGLLAVDHGIQQNGRHEVIQMNQLPPQWYAILPDACPAW